MKRKLIDLPEDVVKRLSVMASQNDCSLKRYIEKSLEQQALQLNDSNDCAYGYKFSSKNDPTDAQLEAIVVAAARKALRNRRIAEDAFFNNIASSINSK